MATPVAAARQVILVEGDSDRAAVEALARRAGRNLAAEGTAVVAMGGATNVGHFVERLGPRGLGLRLAGMCDAAEERVFTRRLTRAGLDAGTSRSDLERIGFYVCHRDLEDELIGSLGPDAVVEVIAAEGELASFQILRQQPAQRTRTLDQQLHRFMGSQSGRKVRYAMLLVEALEPGRVPRPLEQVLAR
ncbi:MAG: TOPRIM nucleotidyl transferase/hydrolase domain-containing protein [Nocardioides sp.]